MKDKLNQLWTGIIVGFDNSGNGFSTKKLAAYTVILCIVAAHIKWIMLADFNQLIMVLTADYAFICACFGLNTIQKIKENNNETK
jgi:hypothetical protein